MFRYLAEKIKKTTNKQTKKNLISKGRFYCEMNKKGTLKSAGGAEVTVGHT